MAASPVAMMQQLQSGALDMGWIQAAELGSRVSTVAAINAPYLVRSTAAVAKLVKTPAALIYSSNLSCCPFVIILVHFGQVPFRI